ncbi:MAG TPA: transcriptional regulator FtrA [Steroidobacteraceae bacterium]|nr:transcriptional regulator FtrA [Steroidobacteraceae bacterium]
MPKPPAARKPANSLVVALVYDGLCAFEFSCAAEVFGLARPELGSDWYRFETCSVRGRDVRGQYGLRMKATGGLERLMSAGTIVIPGWEGIDVPVPAVLLDALRKARARGARLLSICSGSFVLAATGLLDGRRATTHWRYADAFRERFPRVEVDANVLYVDEGGILTSAGSAAGLDLCLHLVRRDWGPAIANQVARRLVIPPHRDGGQAQFLERPVEKLERSSEHREPLAGLLDRILRRIAEPWRNADLARRAAMSERTFMRRFRAATGLSPADWITRARVDRARELLESTALPIGRIAERCGLGTPTTLRHHFRKRLGVSPAAYRRRFS